MMDVKRIVVDELPESCAGKCVNHLYDNPCDFMVVGGGLWCFLTRKSIEENNNPYDTRPKGCPLELEEVCEWDVEYYTEDENFFYCWIFHPKCDRSVEYERPREEIEFTYCPSCGKRIVYKESE